jgi:hypothetical protein
VLDGFPGKSDGRQEQNARDKPQGHEKGIL